MVAVIKDVLDIKQQTISWQAQGKTIGLVPTMGGLHDGHIQLIKTALAHHDKVVVSIYVNPTQFAAGEDLARYPRQLEADCDLLAATDDTITVFAPDSLYHAQHATMIVPQGAALPLEGVHRPHFFSGVTTVVYQLFAAVPADTAYFGEKDFQQLAVIRQMVRDFALPIAIEAVPTCRAPDGLALSSRNGYLSQQERAIAAHLYAEMKRCATEVSQGACPKQAGAQAKMRLLKHGFTSIDYLCWCEPDSLSPASDITGQSRLLVAAYLGETRLIDNENYEKLCGAQK